jgi:hypothetical protein
LDGDVHAGDTLHHNAEPSGSQGSPGPPWALVKPLREWQNPLQPTPASSTWLGIRHVTASGRRRREEAISSVLSVPGVTVNQSE